MTKEKKKVRFPDVVKKMKDVIQPEHEKNLKKPLTRSTVKSLMKVMQTNFNNLFYHNAYIVTNISMMIWSIIYHSWLGFILLVWANVIWIKTNKRENMMKSSPFLVIYAVCLLLINYTYGMKFTDNELPSALTGVNSQQIGLIKYEKYAYIHLFLKSLLTVSFWITMRLMFQEKVIMEHKNTLRFEETIRHLIEEMNNRKNLTTSLLNKLCLYGLMWIIVLSLFAIAVNGEEMTLFRIINMCFFLCFVLLFQLYFKMWLKVMGVFWFTLIIYSMAALMSIYVYQFDNFSEFPWQLEIGLRKYQTGILGVKLFSFTAVIILTGIQMNHFHGKFLKLFQNSHPLSVVENGENSTDEKSLSVS